MALTKFQQAICNLVKNKPGIHETELEIIVRKNPQFLSLIDTGEIVKLEYVLPKVEYEIGVMLFPKGTRFCND